MQHEQFNVLDGSLQFSIRGRQLDRASGDGLDVAPGVPHSFRNVTDTPARFRVVYTPALRLEGFFQALYALGAAGKVNRQGVPSPLWIATLMWEFPDEFFYLPVVPWWLQRALAAPLALLGRVLGYSSPKAA
jgi:cupin domain